MHCVIPEIQNEVIARRYSGPTIKNNYKKMQLTLRSHTG